MLFGDEDPTCSLSHQPDRQGLKIIYGARPFRTLWYGPIGNGFVIICTIVRSPIFLPREIRGIRGIQHLILRQRADGGGPLFNM